MFTLLKIIRHQGRQYIPDPLSASLAVGFPGRPVIGSTPCPDNCHICSGCCPAGAIQTAPPAIDLGRCVFCGECERQCPDKKIVFTNDHRLATNKPQSLVVKQGHDIPLATDPDLVRKEIRRIFGRSLKLRLVSAGSCNGCEMELNACGNVNFDMDRYGIEFLASPRHCDGVVLTGPVVENSVEALRMTLEAVPAPRILILAGSCAISGGIFDGSPAVNRHFLSNFKPDLLIPGCPPHPLTIIHGIVQLSRKMAAGR